MPQKKADDDAAVLEKIAGLKPFEDVAARLHDLIMRSAPDLKPRLWYGMPGYAKAKNSPVICFFRVDDDQYLSFGVTENANLRPDGDSKHMITSSWFLTGLDAAAEKRIAAAVQQAAS